MNTVELTGWSLGWTDAPDRPCAETVSAWVPSDVQLVWQKQKGLPDYNYGTNYHAYDWMESKYWVYSCPLSVPAAPGTHVDLFFESIDYRYTVCINGQTLCRGEGMFTPVTVPLDAFQGQSVTLTVMIHPVPAVPGLPAGRDQASHSVKPPVSYGWDWHPHLVPSGLSGRVLLRTRAATHLEDTAFSYVLSERMDEVTLHGQATVACPDGATVSLILTDENGQTVGQTSLPAASANALSLTLEHPALWYPIRRGKQTRYRAAIRLTRDGTVLEEVGRPIGFRRVRLQQNITAEPERFPKGQLPNSITLEVNGERLFGKGTNYVPNEIFYSRMTRERYAAVLTKARDANMNLLRVWGGGLTNREDFFDLCDEMGLMVWQEFPLACNNYPDDPHYLAVLDQESTSIIRRLRTHPSLVIWCGGNELFNSWSGMTNQSLALRLLDKNCLMHDPHTPFMMTSPTCGMAHGHYAELSGPDREVLSDFIDSDNTAYTEFGSPAPAPLSYIRDFCPPDQLYSPRPDNCWLDHHAFHAWNAEATWFSPAQIEAYCGKADTLEETIENGLTVQAASYQGLFEAVRRKWPDASMALNWCFNEPWPCFANNSLLLYPDIPRPAYFAVRQALRDTMLSAALYKLRWHSGETAEVPLFVLNDAGTACPGGSMRVMLEADGQSRMLYEGSYPAVAGGTVKQVGACRFTVEEALPRRFTLRVEADDPRLSSTYQLFHV